MKENKELNLFKENKKEIFNIAKQLIEEKNRAILKRYKLIELEDLEQKDEVRMLTRTMFTPIGAWKHYQHMLKSGEAIMVIMQTKNGYMDIFYKYPVAQRFVFNAGSYVLDDSKKMFVRSHNCFAYAYHEGCSLPYKHLIDVTEIQKAFKEGEINVRLALNPLTLSEYLSSDVVKTAVAGNDAFAKMIWMIALIAFVILIQVVMMVILIFK